MGSSVLPPCLLKELIPSASPYLKDRLSLSIKEKAWGLSIQRSDPGRYRDPVCHGEGITPPSAELLTGLSAPLRNSVILGLWSPFHECWSVGWSFMATFLLEVPPTTEQEVTAEVGVGGGRW